MQIIAFLAGLHNSGLYRPSLIVCPATVLRQWLTEVRRWAPSMRVVLLHDAGRNMPKGATRASREELVQTVVGHPQGLLLTTYEALRIRRDLLLPIR